MNKTMKAAAAIAGIFAMATGAIASGAIAQETKRGNGTGGGQAKSGQTAASETGKRAKNGNGQQSTQIKAQQPVSVPAAAPPAPIASTPSSGWFGHRNANTYGIDRRQATQAREIERGVRNGSLTANEAAQLRTEQARILEMERQAKADGRVTRDERQHIRDAQRQADAHIWQESHDRERNGRGHRWGAGWGRGWW